jgi:hypothetical protein
MLIAPNPLVLCFVRRSGQTSASEYVGVSAPPNEAGGSYKHGAPPGQCIAANFGTILSSF